MDPIEQFFYANAAFSYDPATETEWQGRVRCARELANAEHVLLDAWPRADFDVQEDAYAGREHDIVPLWACITLDGNVIASLGGIYDMDDIYKRVIRAELALECIETLKAK